MVASFSWNDRVELVHAVIDVPAGSRGVVKFYNHRDEVVVEIRRLASGQVCSRLLPPLPQAAFRSLSPEGGPPSDPWRGDPGGPPPPA